MQKANMVAIVALLGVNSALLSGCASAQVTQPEIVKAPEIEAKKDAPPIIETITAPEKEIVRQKGGELRIDGIGENKTKLESEDAVIIPDTDETNIAPVPPPIPMPPPKPLTKEEIAKEIAPNFDVTKDYTRLTQCYGTADFLGALTTVRASQAGASPQLKAIANSINALKAQMQPFVLASATVKTEAKFRSDYDKIARIVQDKVFAQSDFNAALKPHLLTMDACSKDVQKWRVGK